MAKKSESKKINVKLVKSFIGATKAQVKVANALGLKKTNQVVEHYETPIIRGMINKIPHMLEVNEA
ncbi:50S ribosomal protein L30 [bacterium]|nr:50S ribosomal protein L30 [bacterium]